MKFELFTPVWKSENAQRRAKALDGMKEEKLLAMTEEAAGWCGRAAPSI